MMYVRLDCLMRMNPKIAALKSSTCWFFVCCIGYANQYQTGGFVPFHALSSLWTSKQEPRFQHRKHLAELVGAGLLQPSENAYRIHDYFDYQLSPDTIEQRRAGDRARQQRRRAKLAAEATAERAWTDKALPGRSTREQAHRGRESDCVSVASDAVNATSSLTTDSTCEQSTTQHAQAIFSHAAEIVQVKQEHHAMTSRYVTHQSSNMNTRSDRISADASEPDMARVPSAVSDAASLLALFARDSGWGILPASLFQRFEDLDPFPDRAELTMVHRMIERQITCHGRQIDSYAGYALRVLQNRRASGAIRSPEVSKTQRPSGPITSVKDVQMERESKLELYEMLSENLSGSHWHASLTMGTIDLLWQHGLTSVCQILPVIDALEKDCASSAAPRSWPTVVDTVSKREPDGPKCSTRYIE